MSFADELRNEPNRYRQEQAARSKANWNDIASTFHKIIKDICREVAQDGERDLHLDLRSLVESYFEEPYTYDDYYYDDGEEIHELSFDESPRGEAWEQMRKFFYHYGLGRQTKSEQYPKTYGLFREDADSLQNSLLTMLKKDGLHVIMNIRKVGSTYREEQSYVEYSSLDRFFAGKDGYMKTKRVEGQTLHTILIDLSW